jgi:hypothetical protein
VPTMADSVNPAALPPGMAAYAGYVDGAKSKWPPTWWAKFTVPVLKITTLASLDAMAFDYEPGNAGSFGVAVAVRGRTNGGLPSVVYLNEDGLVEMTSALAGKSLSWLPVWAWPHPGPYIWPADWSIPPGTIPSWCPVRPVAVQDRSYPDFDLSTLYTNWLPVIPPPGPVPPSTGGKGETVVIVRGPNGAAYVISGGKAVGLTTGAEIIAAQQAGIPVWQFSNQTQFDALVTAFG